MNAPTPLEQLARVAVNPRQVSIGLPASLSSAERRFPMTPEAAAMLVERGFAVKMQSGAAETIHYSDEAYSRYGVEIVTRKEAFRCDIVIYLPAISDIDAGLMQRGTLLLGFSHMESRRQDDIKVLLEKSITTIAIDRISDELGHHPFADILCEIDGRAAIAIASAFLADAVHGKGILLGGVAGVVPCEVTIIGADIAAIAAARSVVGLGATVRVFDNDSYRLRRLTDAIGQGVIASTLHPKVLLSALRSADILIACTMTKPFEVGADAVAEMKRGVITFDLDPEKPSTFPSMPTIDLAFASPCDNNIDSKTRFCYINAGNAVPRTAAMALSNTLLTMLDDLIACDSPSNALKLIPGLRGAALTYLGKPVAPDVAKLAGVRHVDINILLQCS